MTVRIAPMIITVDIAISLPGSGLYQAEPGLAIGPGLQATEIRAMPTRFHSH